MTGQTIARTTRRKRRWPLWLGLILLELLLMGSAFVGGRMLAQQNQRAARPPGSGQLPSQLPKDPVAGTGTVQRIQDTVITLAGRGGGGPGGGGGSSTLTEVVVGTDTKYYKNVTAQGNPGGGQPQLQVQDATLTDVKIGNTILVWGAKNGQRITAEVVYIQSFGR